MRQHIGLVYFFLLFALPVIVAQPKEDYIIRDIRFEGLRQTRETWLRTYVTSKEGEHFSIQTYERDLQNIRNLNLFFSVEGEWIVSEDSVDIIIRIREARYVYPYFYIGGFENSFQLALGLSKINWRGEGATLGAWYRYYDRHSVSIFYEQPRFPGSTRGFNVFLWKYGTIEPLYFDGEKGMTLYDLYNVSAKLHQWQSIDRKISIGLNYFYEKYTGFDDFTKSQLPLPLKRNKALLSLEFVKDKRDFSYEIVKGAYFKILTEYVYTLEEPDYPFYSVQVEWKEYRMIHPGNINIAARLNASIGTNRISPYLPFVVDGYINVRGAGDRIARGTALALFNLELRKRIYTHPLAIFQGVLLTDIAWLRTAGTPIDQWLRPHSNYTYLGAGGRIILQKWYHIVLRLDYSRAVRNSNGATGGWVLGVGQFF